MIRIRNADESREIIFDNKFYVLNKLEIDAVDTELSTSKGIKQVGEYLNSSSIGTRDIAITGYILADNIEQMRSRKRELIKLINPLKNFYFIQDDYKLNCIALDTI